MTSLSSGETYTYDANGNMSCRVEGGINYKQEYNFENLLSAVKKMSGTCASGTVLETTTFVYDGDGNLVKKIKPDGSKTIYVGGIYEVDKTSGGTVTRTVTYYPAAGAMRINITGGSNTLYYILKDHLGSASVVTDASGVTMGEQRYYPYGETRLTTGTIYTDKLFTGQREMAGLGIYDYGARFYSPKLGRFLSPDTIVPGAGNPQAFNRYSYVLGNPLKYIDPSGHGQCQTKEDCADMGTTPMGTGGSGGGSTGGGGGGGGGGHHDDLPDPNPSCVGCEGYEQDAVDCSIQACIGVPDYWDLNLSHPDYYTLALSGSLATVTFTVDRYGHVYWAFGVSVNTSIIGGPPGISLMAGKIGQSILDTHNPIPDVNTIPSFLTGFAGSIDVGLGPAGGLTFSPGSEVPNNIGTVSTFAPQGGLSTPFAGGSVTYGIQFQNEAVNHAGQWLIQNVIMRSLP